MGDRSADGVCKNRPVLADVSNQLGKRRFVSISTSSGNENQKNVENEGGKSSFLGKDYAGVESLGKGKYVFEFGGKGDSSVLKAKQLGGSWKLDNGANTLQQSGGFGILRASGETKEPLSLCNDNLQLTQEDAVKKSELEKGDGLKDSSMSSGLMPRVLGNQDQARSSLSLIGEEYDEGSGSEITRNPSGSNAVTNICESNGEGIDSGDLTSNKSRSLGGSIPSSGSKTSESEKCTNFNYDGSSNITGIDLLKTCSCSFCLKAAYIWTDLQYQDTKGRIAALKRSRKDTRTVIERSCSYGGFGRAVQVNSNKPTKLEHDLMGQWRSLFLHTEDVLIRENSQLQSSLTTLKELRENCKADLEMTNAISSNR